MSLPFPLPGDVLLLQTLTTSAEGIKLQPGTQVIVLRRMTGSWWQCRTGTHSTAMLSVDMLSKAKLVGHL